MADKKVPPQYRYPAAVYQLPTAHQNLQMTYLNAACTASKDKDNPGFQCKDVFLKVHGPVHQYLLVPNSKPKGPVALFRAEASGKPTALPAPKEVFPLGPIDSDFIDTHGGDGDCR